MEEAELKIVKDELRAKFNELIGRYNMNYKDELKILAMLTDDVSNQLVGSVTIISK